MKAEYKDIVTANVYPAPKVGAGIAVGVHFTPTVNERRGEQMIVGPGSSICLDREAYKASDFSVKELMRLTGNVGAMKFVASNLGLSISEAYRDLSKTAFLNEARKLIPTITDDMVEESFVGVMGTAFSHIDGKVINEFEFDRKAMDGLVLHVRNTPSPACTASFALAEDIASTAAADFAWE
ncbi:hypothetical protein SARC_10002 [Sphaeroforma arctica JP610]|uniref:Uncharacterized protein n=1 Tax=Sphaeroforma arctica JP610 TaxID=667725 RepID=A0A0L0FM32_9EUKA|nr:hypothetical protein SARC_10002 [Sphaeroforma arctica JP610]KNC77541.1 hypothetical protein SARC_10002 [Sphaeroforma arctica JP610]|eukprot:XP_014151443.1 hypothetical protein SARC_10002 [Sphaeroforma arctica JP610]